MHVKIPTLQNLKGGAPKTSKPSSAPEARCHERHALSVIANPRRLDLRRYRSGQVSRIFFHRRIRTD